MLLEKKQKILSYLKSDDNELKELGLKILRNNLSPKVNVWFYIMIPSFIRNEITELTLIVPDGKELVSYVRKHYSEMDDDSRKEFYNWIVFKTFMDVARAEPGHTIKDVYEYFK